MERRMHGKMRKLDCGIRMDGMNVGWTWAMRNERMGESAFIRDMLINRTAEGWMWESVGEWRERRAGGSRRELKSRTSSVIRITLGWVIDRSFTPIAQ